MRTVKHQDDIALGKKPHNLNIDNPHVTIISVTSIIYQDGTAMVNRLGSAQHAMYICCIRVGLRRQALWCGDLATLWRQELQGCKAQPACGIMPDDHVNSAIINIVSAMNLGLMH